VTPLVSILIPAYNAEKVIAETLESAIAQTWPNREIIVVDDGSTDGTLAVAKRYESSTVKVFGRRNGGAAATRNEAFSLSQGDYIQWLDADDLLVPRKIELQLEALRAVGNPRIIASGPWAYFFYRHRRARFRMTPLCADLTPAEWLIRKMGQNLHMQTATWLVPRHIVEAAGSWNTQLLGDDDGEYFCRVLLASEGVKFVPEAKVYYRRSAGSLSYVGHSSRKIEAQFLSMQLHIGYLRSLEDTPRVREACVTYLQNWLLHFYPERPDIVERAGALAKELGGSLGPPRFSWKYAWLGALGRPDLAKRVQVFSRNCRASATRSLDKFMQRVERLGRAQDCIEI
jgi:glycosyltransferase involved in cell wall biosynthesis